MLAENAAPVADDVVGFMSATFVYVLSNTKILRTREWECSRGDGDRTA